MIRRLYAVELDADQEEGFLDAIKQLVPDQESLFQAKGAIVVTYLGESRVTGES